VRRWQSPLYNSDAELKAEEFSCGAGKRVLSRPQFIPGANVLCFSQRDTTVGEEGEHIGQAAKAAALRRFHFGEELFRDAGWLGAYEIRGDEYDGSTPDFREISPFSTLYEEFSRDHCSNGDLGSVCKLYKVFPLSLGRFGMQPVLAGLEPICFTVGHAWAWLPAAFMNRHGDVAVQCRFAGGGHRRYAQPIESSPVLKTKNRSHAKRLRFEV
jgi:hypothetical protein